MQSPSSLSPSPEQGSPAPGGAAVAPEKQKIAPPLAAELTAAAARGPSPPKPAEVLLAVPLPGVFGNLSSWGEVLQRVMVSPETFAAFVDIRVRSERFGRVWNTVVEHLNTARVTARSLCPSEVESCILPDHL